jgi:hypothetical protein
MIFEGKVVKAKAHIDCPYCGKVCEFDYEEINKCKYKNIYLKLPCCNSMLTMFTDAPAGISRHQYFSVTFSDINDNSNNEVK